MRLPSGAHRGRSAESTSFRGVPPSSGTDQTDLALLLAATSGTETENATVLPSGEICGSDSLWIRRSPSTSKGRFWAGRTGDRRRDRSARDGSAGTRRAENRILAIISHHWQSGTREQGIRTGGAFRCVGLLRYVHMRTNIVIDDALMAEALKASGLKTKREVVELGLKTISRLAKQANVRSLRGIGWQGDLETMRTDVAEPKG